MSAPVDSPPAGAAAPVNDRQATSLDAEIIIVGAGISGIGAGIELLRHGHESFMILEAEDELGGTWRDNTYPGVAVDIPFSSYCYSFETDYPWSRLFPEGREIRDYVAHCARKYGIADRVRCRSQVLRSEFDARTDTWTTRLAGGEVLRSRYLISATGLLSQPKMPDIPGLDAFAGKVMHSARWDHGHDLAGKRVAVIGTGASAVQIVPAIAASVDHLCVFQRTPIWVGPRPDGRLGPRFQSLLHRIAPLRSLLRALSETSIEALSFAIVSYRRLPFIVRGVQAGVRAHMRRSLEDPDLIARLIPAYGLGCKRPATSNTYLQAFRRSNVSLVTAGIDRIVPQGVVSSDGVLHGVDTLVLATGFLTTERGNAPSFEVAGDAGIELGAFWDEHRLQAYAGVAVPGFPNFFLTAGPYSGGFNWFTMLNAHLGHILRCLAAARAEGATRIEVRREAHERYMQRMWQHVEGTIFKSDSCRSANSYYLDRFGDASLPLPRTPWWRVLWNSAASMRAYQFSGQNRM